MRINLLKTLTGLSPADTEAEEFLRKKKLGSVLSADIKTIRNYQFHKKWFALLTIGYDNWTPSEINATHSVPMKNFNRFRADVIILCGYYDRVFRLDGSVRIDPKSVSFAKMSEETFADLYSKTIDVLIKHVYGGDMDADKLNSIVQKYLDFA